jgi:hypothetical protein
MVLFHDPTSRVATALAEKVVSQGAGRAQNIADVSV